MRRRLRHTLLPIAGVAAVTLAVNVAVREDARLALTTRVASVALVEEAGPSSGSGEAVEAIAVSDAGEATVAQGGQAEGNAMVEAAARCERADGWYWFEDGNGDGDTDDPEDGICVQGERQPGRSWNGDQFALQRDNTYIAAYTCSGSFPRGYVASYSGIGYEGEPDTEWNDGDCAICQVDCYDGRKDLPEQGGYVVPVEGKEGHGGPINPNVLAAWQGTRLPTRREFFGVCGFKDGKEKGDNYATSCSGATLHGEYGQLIGRTDECLDVSDSGVKEWLNGQRHGNHAQIGGYNACSDFNGNGVNQPNSFRAVVRAAGLIEVSEVAAVPTDG